MAWPTMAEYQEAIQSPELCFADPDLQQGTPLVDKLGLPKPITGGFASVYQMICEDGRKFAVRCFLGDFPDQEERYSIISNYLQQVKLPYTVGFEFFRQGIKIRNQWYPILKMEWVEGEPLNQYLQRNLENPLVFQDLAQKFLKLVSSLKDFSVAHGDLQHGNILIVENDFRLIDYDGMYVPGLNGKLSHELGQRNYQHPTRSAKDFGPQLDNFSTWVIYLSLIAFSLKPELWQQVGAGDEWLLLREEDFKQPTTSEALRLLEEVGDKNIKPLAATFRELIATTNLAQIIPITDKVKKVKVSDPNALLTVPGTDLSIPKASWVWQQVIIPYKRMMRLYSPRRIALLFAMAMITLLTFISLSITAGLIISAPLIAVIFGAIVTTFVLRYQNRPQLVARNRLNSEYNRLQGDIKNIEDTITRINLKKRELELANYNANRNFTAHQIELANLEKAEIDRVKYDLEFNVAALNSQRQGVIMDITTKEREVLERENHELGKVEKELQNSLALLRSRREVLQRAEEEELANLFSKQNALMTEKLASYSLAEASIDGIGSELIRRLSNAGILSAADVVDAEVVQAQGLLQEENLVQLVTATKNKVFVDGITEQKAASLLKWRQQIEDTIADSWLQNHPELDKATIEDKYSERYFELDSDLEEVSANFKAEQERKVILSRYQPYKDTLVRQLQSANDFYNKEIQGWERKIAEHIRAIIMRGTPEKHETTRRARLSEQAFNKAWQELDQQGKIYANQAYNQYWKRVELERELQKYEQVTFPEFVREIVLPLRPEMIEKEEEEAATPL